METPSTLETLRTLANERAAVNLKIISPMQFFKLICDRETVARLALQPCGNFRAVFIVPEFRGKKAAIERLARRKFNR